MIASSTRSYIYALTAGQTGPLACPWPVLVAADLDVIRQRAGMSTRLVLNVDYTIVFSGSPATTASVSLTAAALAGDSIALLGNRAIARATAFTGFGAGSLKSQPLNDELDRLVISQQELRRDTDRALKVSLFDSNAYDAGGRKITGVADGSGSTDLVTIGQIGAQLSAATSSATALALAARDAAYAARDIATTKAADAAAARDAAIAARDAAVAALNEGALTGRLSTTGRVVTDWDTATSSGFYCAAPGAAHGPPETTTLNSYGWVTAFAPTALAQIVTFWDGSNASTTTLTYRRDATPGVGFGAWYRTHLSTDEINALIAASVGYANVANYAGATHAARINAAAATGLPVYIPAANWVITAPIIPAVTGQRFFGDGEGKTVLQVTSAFSGLGVFKTSAFPGEPGPEVCYLTIAFDQPDTNVRANLTTYPPAFYFRDTPRFHLHDLSVLRATVGIDMKGNSGGAYIDRVKMSTFDIDIDIDGSLDTVRINRVHLWNFGLTANQTAIFSDTSNVGIKSGRCDGLTITDLLAIATSKALWLYQSALGVTFGSGANLHMDDSAGIVISAGDFTIASGYSSLGGTTGSIAQSGGNLSIGTFRFFTGISSATPIIDQIGGNLTITGSTIAYNPNTDRTFVRSASSDGTGTALVCQGNMFAIAGQSSTTRPIIQFTGSNARGAVVGNVAKDNGGSLAKFISIPVDDFWTVAYNAVPGWTNTIPASPSYGKYV